MVLEPLCRTVRRTTVENHRAEPSSRTCVRMSLSRGLSYALVPHCHRHPDRRGGCGSTIGAATDPGRRLHALRAARARHRAVPDLLRGDRDHAGRALLLQRDPSWQRRHRRTRRRSRDRTAAQVGSRQRQTGTRGRPSRPRISKPNTSRCICRARCPTAARSPADRQDLQGRQELYREGDAIVFDRSLGIRRNTIVLPRGLSTGQLQRALAGDAHDRWSCAGELHEPRAGGGATGHPRQARVCRVQAGAADSSRGPPTSTSAGIAGGAA